MINSEVFSSDRRIALPGKKYPSTQRKTTTSGWPRPSRKFLLCFSMQTGVIIYTSIVFSVVTSTFFFNITAEQRLSPSLPVKYAYGIMSIYTFSTLFGLLFLSTGTFLLNAPIFKFGLYLIMSLTLFWACISILSLMPFLSVYQFVCIDDRCPSTHWLIDQSFRMFLENCSKLALEEQVDKKRASLISQHVTTPTTQIPVKVINDSSWQLPTEQFSSWNDAANKTISQAWKMNTSSPTIIVSTIANSSLLSANTASTSSNNMPEFKNQFLSEESLGIASQKFSSPKATGKSIGAQFDDTSISLQPSTAQKSSMTSMVNNQDYLQYFTSLKPSIIKHWKPSKSNGLLTLGDTDGLQSKSTVNSLGFSVAKKVVNDEVLEPLAQSRTNSSQNARILTNISDPQIIDDGNEKAVTSRLFVWEAKPYIQSTSTPSSLVIHSNGSSDHVKRSVGSELSRHAIRLNVKQLKSWGVRKVTPTTFEEIEKNLRNSSQRKLFKRKLKTFMFHAQLIFDETQCSVYNVGMVMEITIILLYASFSTYGLLNSYFFLKSVNFHEII